VAALAVLVVAAVEVVELVAAGNILKLNFLFLLLNFASLLLQSFFWLK